MKLFIHRWFSGSVHPKVLFVKGKQWNYPRLANYAVPMMAGAIITGGHLFFVVGFCLVVPLFLYTALNPLSLEQWLDCYGKYWYKRGYYITEVTITKEGIAFGSPNYFIHTPTRKEEAKTKRLAISLLYSLIYGKPPMRV